MRQIDMTFWHEVLRITWYHLKQEGILDIQTEIYPTENCPILLKTSKDIKDKGRGTNCSKLKRTKNV